jgi:hypothetical protein
MRAQAARRLGMTAAVIGLALAPRGAYAQFGTGAVGGASGGLPATASQMANPYTNPMMNPFLNPYMAAFSQPATTQNTAQNAAMYFFAAQAASGGIGSGQLSGSRPAPGAGRSSASSRAATAATRSQKETGAVRISDIPGGGAARYFGRSAQSNAGPSSYFNRPNPARNH